MLNYVFRTTTTMTEYNRKKWWIDPDFIEEIRITADNIKDALRQYSNMVNDKYAIEISNNALTHKAPMYIDYNGEPRQVGYVLVASAEFRDDIKYKWSRQYINLWVNIEHVSPANFEEV